MSIVLASGSALCPEISADHLKPFSTFFLIVIIVNRFKNMAVALYYIISTGKF